MKIINESDSRFKLLDIIFQKYNFESISIRYDDGYLEYFIPPELVISDYKYGSCEVYGLKLFNENSDVHNLVYPSKLSIFLNECCDLTSQELFDLCVLHINDTDDRPKCPECNRYIKFSGEFQRGYSRHHWTNEPSHRLFCCNSCRTSYMHHHLDEYPHMIDTVTALSEVGYDPYKQFKSALIRSLNQSIDSKSDFYISISGEDFKFGISIHANDRILKVWNSNNYSYRYITMDVRITSLLEFLIKVESNYLDKSFNSEYQSKSYIPTFKKLFRKYYKLLNSYSDTELDNLIDNIKSNKLDQTSLVKL